MEKLSVCRGTKITFLKANSGPKWVPGRPRLEERFQKSDDDESMSRESLQGFLLFFPKNQKRWAILSCRFGAKRRNSTEMRPHLYLKTL